MRCLSQHATGNRVRGWTVNGWGDGPGPTTPLPCSNEKRNATLYGSTLPRGRSPTKETGRMLLYSDCRLACDLEPAEIASTQRHTYDSHGV
jgi:hypothetical protein